MRLASLLAFVVACGCKSEGHDEWVVSAGACDPSTATPRTLLIAGDGNSEIVTGTAAGARLVAHSPSGSVATSVALPAGAQTAVRHGDEMIVVGDAPPPDGSLRAPFVALVDSTGKPRWVVRLPLGSPFPSDTSVHGLLAVAVQGGTIAVTASAFGSSAGGGRLALLSEDGRITAEASIDQGEGPARIAFDRDGVVVATRDSDSFSIAAFDLAAKPRWRREFVGSLSSVASCGDGVLASATVTDEGPQLLRLDPSGGSLPSIAALTAGAVAACDARGIAVAGTMIGVLADHRFMAIGSEGRTGAYLATFSLEGKPGTLRPFGGEHVEIGAIALADEFVLLTGTYRGTLQVGTSTATVCASASPMQDVFVARVRR